MSRELQQLKPGNVEIVGWSEEQFLQCLEAQRSTGLVVNPNELSLQVFLTNNILNALLDLFYSYASRQPTVQWNSLFLLQEDEEEFDTTLLYHALRIANEASLFRSIEFDFQWNASFRNATAVWILPSLEDHHRLTRLSLSLDFDLSLKDTESLCRTLSSSETLTELVLDIPNIGESCICDAVALNRSLENVSISVTNEQVALNLCHALAMNPNLKSVTLNTTTESNHIEPIRVLLTSEICQLEMLRMDYNVNRCAMDTDEFLQALSKNKSLKSLYSNWTLSGERPFSNLLAVIKDHPTLESLHLHQRFTIPDIQEATSHIQQPFPRLLQVSNLKFAIRSPDGSYEKALEAFLNAHWEVSFATNGTWAQRIAYTNHLNLAGRYLMRRPNIPSGLWPLVLAMIGTRRSKKSADDFEKYRDSILYEFLHGPALVGMGT